MNPENAAVLMEGGNKENEIRRGNAASPFCSDNIRYHDHFIIASGYSDRYCVIYR